EVYQIIIPPLSAERKLPQVDSIIKWAREQARPHEQLGHWKEATDAYLWLFRQAETFQDGITPKATALLMEHLRAVTSAIELRKAQAFKSYDIEELEDLESDLVENLETASVDIRVAI